MSKGDGAKHYSLTVLQEVLNLLWKNANEDGYVLMVPSQILEGKRRTIGGALISLIDLKQIFEIFEGIEVVKLFTYQMGEHSLRGPYICKVVEREIDLDRYATFYKSNEIVALMRQVTELQEELNRTRAKLASQQGNAPASGNTDG